MENKTEFCQRLGFALRCSREEIQSCEYQKIGSEEICRVNFRNGNHKDVCITWDSCVAIMIDVAKALI